MSECLNEQQLLAALQSMPGWEHLLIDGTDAIGKCWHLKDFAGAFALAGRIADLAETHNHHPRLTIDWGKLTVLWWSHDAGGVTSADLDMARLCDASSE